MSVQTAPDSTLRCRSQRNETRYNETRSKNSLNLRTLINSDGQSWIDFRRQLKPRYAIVWCDIGLRFAFIALGYALHGWICATLPAAVGWALVPCFALWLGLWLASVSNFGHEAVHFNLAKNRQLNDFLANALLLGPFGRQVDEYRALHWEHHKHLGEPEDTEISYHQAPTRSMVLSALLCVYPIRVLLGNLRRSRTASSHQRVGTAKAILWLAWGGLLHCVPIAVALVLGWYAAAAAWFFAVASIFPAAVALRQILEHRSEHADASADFRHTPHGAVTRIFAPGWLSLTLGSAGFNRHLLHHWDPSISYTRLGEMERFLEATSAAEALRHARTSYTQAFQRLTTHG